MKALRWYGRNDLRYEEIPEPSPEAGEVKIKVNLAGICGTDLKEYSSGPCIINGEDAPVTMTTLSRNAVSMVPSLFGDLCYTPSL